MVARATSTWASTDGIITQPRSFGHRHCAAEHDTPDSTREQVVTMSSPELLLAERETDVIQLKGPIDRVRFWLETVR